MYCFVWVPSKTLKGFHGFASVDGQVFKFVGKISPSLEVLLVEFAVPDSESMVFESACGCFENEEEFQVRWHEAYEWHFGFRV